MEESIYLLCKKINSALKNSEVFTKLDCLEKEMENSEEVMKLSYLKDVACIKYGDLLKVHNENDLEVKAALKELYVRKYELDNNYIVKEYLKLFGQVKEILYQMNKIIFEDYISKESI